MSVCVCMHIVVRHRHTHPRTPPIQFPCCQSDYLNLKILTTKLRVESHQRKLAFLSSIPVFSQLKRLVAPVETCLTVVCDVGQHYKWLAIVVCD